MVACAVCPFLVVAKSSNGLKRLMKKTNFIATASSADRCPSPTTRQPCEYGTMEKATHWLSGQANSILPLARLNPMLFARFRISIKPALTASKKMFGM